MALHRRSADARSQPAPAAPPGVAEARRADMSSKRPPPPRSSTPSRACRLLRLLPLAHLLLCALLHRREARLRWDQPEGSRVPLRIPKRIHQIHHSAQLPPRWRETPSHWIRHHPDYDYQLWTDEELHALIAREYPWLLRTYEAYPYDVQRWDASRYALLHHYGGIYADLDVSPADSIAAGKSLSKPLSEPLSETLSKTLSKSLSKSLSETLSKSLSETLSKSLRKSLSKPLSKPLTLYSSQMAESTCFPMHTPSLSISLNPQHVYRLEFVNRAWGRGAPRAYAECGAHQRIHGIERGTSVHARCLASAPEVQPPPSLGAPSMQCTP